LFVDLELTSRAMLTVVMLSFVFTLNVIILSVFMLSYAASLCVVCASTQTSNFRTIFLSSILEKLLGSGKKKYSCLLIFYSELLKDPLIN